MADPIERMSFDNSGVDDASRPLGPTETLSYYMNSIQVKWRIPGETRKKYKRLKVRQDAGPWLIWKFFLDKEGQFRWGHVADWRNHASRDDPADDVVTLTTASISMYDEPGQQMTGFVGNNIVRIFTIQNFVCWVEGQLPHASRWERLSEMTSWNSAVHLISENAQGTKWSRGAQNSSSLGWRDLKDHPSA